MNGKRNVDWDAIERDYRAGILSFAEIGARHGVTKGRISQVAKAKGWERDLSAKIQAKAEAKLNAAAVNAELNAGKRIAESEVIEANAARIAQVRGEHRSDIARGRRLCMALFGELEVVTDNLELFQELGELMLSPDEDGKVSRHQDKLNAAYLKVIDIGGRVGSVKALSEAMRNFVGLEREAYGIGKEDGQLPGDDEPTNPLELARSVAFLLASGEQALKKRGG